MDSCLKEIQVPEDKYLKKGTDDFNSKSNIFMTEAFYDPDT